MEEPNRSRKPPCHCASTASHRPQWWVLPRLVHRDQARGRRSARPRSGPHGAARMPRLRWPLPSAGLLRPMDVGADGSQAAITGGRSMKTGQGTADRSGLIAPTHQSGSRDWWLVAPSMSDRRGDGTRPDAAGRSGRHGADPTRPARQDSGAECASVGRHCLADRSLASRFGPRMNDLWRRDGRAWHRNYMQAI